MTTWAQAIEHERRRRTPWGRFVFRCWVAEAVLVSIAGAWEVGQRIRDRRILNKPRT